MIDWSTVRALTFDCYGTLVDWETGLLRDLKLGLVTRFGKPIEGSISDEELLRLYAQAEPAAQSVAYRSYREVLKTALDRVAASAHFKPRDLDALGAGLPTWPIFPDTTASLARLAGRFRLGVITNCDRDLFAATATAAGLTGVLSETVTAEDVRAYKPATKPFEEMLRRLGESGIPAAAVVHVCCSRFHDVVPAKALGLRVVMIERPAARKGGAAPSAAFAAAPDLTLGSLAALADAALA
jgi:2-haloalkanoic acid dehalogenase type II